MKRKPRIEMALKDGKAGMSDITNMAELEAAARKASMPAWRYWKLFVETVPLKELSDRELEFRFLVAMQSLGEEGREIAIAAMKAMLPEKTRAPE